MTTGKLFTALILLVLTFQAHGFEKEEREKIERTLGFSNPSAKKTVVVDNVNGSIHVEGYAGSEVQLVVHKKVYAETTEKLATAKRKITLDISEEDNTIVLYVDAPYRRRDGGVNHRGWRYYGYDAEFDFDLKVPSAARIFLKTINDGDIRVQNVRGDFELDNINGGIEFSGAAGSGRVYALNGDVTVTFDRNPESKCFFGSLNGDVEVTFLPGLAADLRFKTFNGDVYTDFPVSYVPPRQAKRKRDNGKFVYKADRAFGARVGAGGPELEFDAFNGDIHIIEKAR